MQIQENENKKKMKIQKVKKIIFVVEILYFYNLHLCLNLEIFFVEDEMNSCQLYKIMMLIEVDS